MAATTRAEATWSGDLLKGGGRVTAATTRVFVDLPISWESRIGENQAMTTPEELLAASHAACYAMACSNILAKAGTPPASLSVSVDVTADTTSAGWTVKSAHITVRGDVPGRDRGVVQDGGRGGEGRLPDLAGAGRQRRALGRGDPRGLTARGAAAPAAPVYGIVSSRRGLSTVIVRISASDTPASRSRGRNASAR